MHYCHARGVCRLAVGRGLQRERERERLQTTKLMMEEVIGRGVGGRFALRGELELWRLLAEEREEEKKRGGGEH